MSILRARVRDRYYIWLQEHERQLEAQPRAGQLGPFWSRMGITTLKLALVLHVGTAGTLLMDDAALTSAIGLTDFLKAALGKLFEEEIAFTPGMKDRQKVLRLITNRPVSASGISSGPRVSRRSTWIRPSRRCAARAPSAKRRRMPVRVRIVSACQ